MRSLFLIAWAIPVVVSGVTFKWLFDGEAGLINYLLTQLGWVRAPIYWLDDPHMSLWTIIIANTWLGIPFFLTLISAALQTIPHTLYEAAAIDGANHFARFWRITLPLLRPALFSCLILGLIYTTRVSDLVWITTQGGPLDSSQVFSTLAYKYVFEQFRFGDGARRSTFCLSFCLDFLCSTSKRCGGRLWRDESVLVPRLASCLPQRSDSGIFSFPIYWLATTAVKPSAEIFAVTPKLIPNPIDWTIWLSVLNTPGIPRYFLNSFIVASGTTALTILLAAPCAYGLAHLP